MTEPTITLSQLEELAALEAEQGFWQSDFRNIVDQRGERIATFNRRQPRDFVLALRSHTPAIIALAREALEARERRALLEAHRKDSTYMDLGLCDERREEAALTKP